MTEEQLRAKALMVLEQANWVRIEAIERLTKQENIDRHEASDIIDGLIEEKAVITDDDYPESPFYEGD